MMMMVVVTEKEEIELVASTRTRPYSKQSTCVIPFYQHKYMNYYLYYPYFSDKETEAWQC